MNQCLLFIWRWRVNFLEKFVSQVSHLNSWGPFVLCFFAGGVTTLTIFLFFRMFFFNKQLLFPQNWVNILDHHQNRSQKQHFLNFEIFFFFDLKVNMSWFHMYFKVSFVLKLLFTFFAFYSKHPAIWSVVRH